MGRTYHGRFVLNTLLQGQSNNFIDPVFGRGASYDDLQVCNDLLYINIASHRNHARKILAC